MYVNLSRYYLVEMRKQLLTKGGLLIVKVVTYKAVDKVKVTIGDDFCRRLVVTQQIKSIQSQLKHIT